MNDGEIAMTMPEAQRIRAIWDALEDGSHDISTELLLAMTAQQSKVTDSDVADALYLTRDL